MSQIQKTWQGNLLIAHPLWRSELAQITAMCKSSLQSNHHYHRQCWRWRLKCHLDVILFLLMMATVHCSDSNVISMNINMAAMQSAFLAKRSEINAIAKCKATDFLRIMQKTKGSMVKGAKWLLLSRGANRWEQMVGTHNKHLHFFVPECPLHSRVYKLCCTNGRLECCIVATL